MISKKRAELQQWQVLLVIHHNNQPPFQISTMTTTRWTHMELIMMILLDLKVYFLFGMMLGEM
jgi:hypothetical protein